MLVGVAGGAAAYLQVDPALTRLAFAALVLAGGAGILLYVIAWIVIPEEPESPALPPAATTTEAAPIGEPPTPPLAAAPAQQTRPNAGRGARLVVGAVLIAVGCMLLLNWALPSLGHVFWPAALVALGLAFLVYGARR
jgi:phage shock protein C